MAKAELIFRRRRELADGAIIEGVVWKLPEPVEASEHLYKYRLFYGYPGQRVIRYDNGRGKGDHKHYFDTESPYTFSTPEQVWSDFVADIIKERESQ
ncbi:MAG: toxin-antitoxin system TumE family protein [Thiolinea sp.]